jgi:integrase/recombinase XerD
MKKILVQNGKGNKARVVGINKKLKDDLEEYILRQRPKTKSKKLFVLPSGKDLTKDRVLKRIKYLFKKAGMDGLMHSFRRGCFTYYAGKGVNLRALQIIAGHSSITVTEQYVRPDIDQIIEDQVNW